VAGVPGERAAAVVAAHPRSAGSDLHRAGDQGGDGVPSRRCPGGGPPGPEGGVGKVFNAEFNQRRTEAAVDAAGLGGVAWMPGDSVAESRAHNFLRARANTIEGGTSEVLRNQIAERLLGLPREPDPERGVAWSKTRR
jgi:alkylation response protein AidB-like acyl-CoA dehydrogenase